ncbi:MAG: hypothetical protein AAB530_02300 [Patescibacteria group bacterium]
MYKKKLKFLLIFLLVGLFFTNLAQAEASTLPKIPVLFYGTIKINNELVAKDTNISVSAKIDNKQLISSFTQTNGFYFLEVPCEEYVNEKILFKINNFISEQQCVDAIVVPSINLDLDLITGGGAIIKAPVLKAIKDVLPVDKILPEEKVLSKVLSVKIYANETLLRGKDKKIYVIKNGKKQHIRSLKELKKYYFGKKIYNVNEDILSKY